MEAEKRRYAGIDLGKREYTMAVIGENGKMSVHHGKTSGQGRAALFQLLEKTDKAALEAGNLAFIMAGEIQERVGSEMRVLNSAKLPIVPIPSKQEMARRKVLANYRREMRDRTRHINTLYALFVHSGHTTIVKKNLATAEKRKEIIGLLIGQEREEAEWILKYLELHEERIAELQKKIHSEAKTDEDMKRLQTVAGVGPVVAYAFVAHVGDGSRFTKGAQVSNYQGLVPKLDYSGTIQRLGHISKRGNSYVRGLIGQAAWATVRSKKGEALAERYRYMTEELGKSKKKTIVGISRRLAEIMYAILRNKTKYEPQQWKGTGNKTAALAAQAMSA